MTSVDQNVGLHHVHVCVFIPPETSLSQHLNSAVFIYSKAMMKYIFNILLILQYTNKHMAYFPEQYSISFGQIYSKPPK